MINARRQSFRGVVGMLYVVGVNIAVFTTLFVLSELAVHLIWPRQNPWLRPPFEKRALRVADPVYGHKRVLFLGDSFTEGLGIPYEQTFVGRFAAAFPQLDVLNAVVSSYAPSVYYAKTKYFIGRGLQIDEIVVYIDVSDVQDEAIFYRFDESDHVQEGNFDERCRSPELLFRSAPWCARWSYTLELFYTRYFLRTISQESEGGIGSLSMGPASAYRRDGARASWTYDPNPACYGEMGVEGGIAKTLALLDRLFGLASKCNIPISVGVYPWPQQLLYDSEESRQVRVWREWCRGECRHFFDHFPAMFAYKREHASFLRDLFIWGDVHYNAFGYELIARDLIADYEKRQVRERNDTSFVHIRQAQ